MTWRNLKCEAAKLEPSYSQYSPAGRRPIVSLGYPSTSWPTRHANRGSRFNNIVLVHSANVLRVTGVTRAFRSDPAMTRLLGSSLNDCSYCSYFCFCRRLRIRTCPGGAAAGKWTVTVVTLGKNIEHSEEHSEEHSDHLGKPLNFTSHWNRKSLSWGTLKLRRLRLPSPKWPRPQQLQQLKQLHRFRQGLSTWVERKWHKQYTQRRKVDRILVKQKSKWDVQNSLALRGVTWSRCRYLPRYLRVSFRGRNLLEVQPWKLPVSENTPLSPEGPDGPEGQVHKFLTTSRHGHVQFKASQAKEAGTARCDSGLLLSIEILTLQCLEMPSWIQVDLKLIVYIVFWVWMGLGECLGTIGGTKMEIIAERCFSTGKPWTFVCIQPLQFPDVEITWRQHWHDVDGTLTGHWRDIDRTLTCMEYAGDNSEVSCGGWKHHCKLEEKYILHAYKRKHVCSHFRKPTVASLFRIWLPAMKLASAPNCLEILQPRSALSPSNDWCTLIPLVGVDPFLPNVVCPSLQRRCLMLKRAGDCAAACEESLVGSSRGGRRLQTSVHLTD